LRSILAVLLVVAVTLVGLAHPAVGQTPQIRGTITYTGDLGPVSRQRPLCLCVFIDPELRQGLGCFIFFNNPAAYLHRPFDANDYYLIAFLDLDLDERHDGNEPYQIYRERAAPPADGVRPAPDLTGIDFTFGDENLAPQPTVTPTQTQTPVATTTPPPCTGDCDRSGEVTIDEIMTLVNISFDHLEMTACEESDRDQSNRIEINEIVAAVKNAALGCPGTR
jgi:hypothetical protein